MKYNIEKDEPKYGVFIIGSMDIDNERNEKLDGLALRTILYLCDIPNDIDYDKAAVFWSSFYFLMDEVNKVHMPQTDLLPILKNVTT